MKCWWKSKTIWFLLGWGLTDFATQLQPMLTSGEPVNPTQILLTCIAVIGGIILRAVTTEGIGR